MLYMFVGIWLLFGFISWVYAYRSRQFLEEREFAVIPMYLVGGFLSYLCLVFYWIKTNMGRKLCNNPFKDFSLRRENKSLYEDD